MPGWTEPSGSTTIVLGPCGVLIGPQATCQSPPAVLPAGGEVLMLKQSPVFPNVTRIDQRTPKSFPEAIVPEATWPCAASGLCHMPSTCGASNEACGADSAEGTV